MPIVRRAIARGATVHTTSEFVAGEIEEIFGPGLRHRGRLVVIPLGVPSTRYRRPRCRRPSRAQLAGAPYVLAIGTLEPRKNLPHLVARVRNARGGASRPAPRHRRPGRSRAARRRRRGRAPRARCCSTRRASRARSATRVGERCSTRRAVLAYPSIYEGFGFPVLEAMTVGVPVVAARAGSIPEVAGDAALLVEPTDEAQLADAIDRVSSPTTRRAASSSRAGTTASREFSWEDTALSLAACYRRLAATGPGPGAMRVACHAGQLLQPVPGGIGRYVRALLARLPDARRRADRVRGRQSPAATCRGECRGSTSAVRPAASATSCWHRLRRPVVRLDVDVVHAPSLAVPPVRGAPLVGHRARHRVPPAAARHDPPRRCVPPARPRARAPATPTLVLAPSAFTRVRAHPRGIRPGRTSCVAPLGVDRPVPRDPTTRSTRRSRAPECARRSCSPSAPSNRARTCRRSSRAVAAAARPATRSRARRRRTDRAGATSSVSTGPACACSATAAVARRRRALPARGLLLHRVALRRLRAPRARSARARRAARRRRRLRAHRGRRRCRPPLPSRRRRRAAPKPSNASSTTASCAANSNAEDRAARSRSPGRRRPWPTSTRFVGPRLGIAAQG